MGKLLEKRSNATAPNEVGTIDWMYDQLLKGKRIWILTVVDTWSRIDLVICVIRSTIAQAVIAALEWARRGLGPPHTIRVGQ